jgi:hypothetical protein
MSSCDGGRHIIFAQQCPPELAQVNSKIAAMSMQTAQAPSVSAPRSLAGARQEQQAPRGQEQQAPRARRAIWRCRQRRHRQR